jgi:hypothetical protein
MLRWSRVGQPVELDSTPQQYLPPGFPRVWRRACDRDISHRVLAHLAQRQRSLSPCPNKRGSLYQESTVVQHVRQVVLYALSFRAQCAQPEPERLVLRRGDHGEEAEAAPSNWQWLRGAPCASRGWTCLFRPLSDAPPSSARFDDASCPAAVARLSLEPPEPRRLAWRARAERPPRWELLLWQAAYTELVSRASDETLAWAATHRRELRPELAAACARFPTISMQVRPSPCTAPISMQVRPSPCTTPLSMQVRRGDKCNRNNGLSGPANAFPCDGLAAYVPALRAIRKAYGSCASASHAARGVPAPFTAAARTLTRAAHGWAEAARVACCCCGHWAAAAACAWPAAAAGTGLLLLRARGLLLLRALGSCCPHAHRLRTRRHLCTYRHGCASRCAYAVRLATDGKAIADQFERGDVAELSNYHVTYHAFDRAPLEARTCTPMPTCQWIEYRGAKLGVNTSGMGLSIVADLELLADGHVFLGQFDSEVGRTIYLRMAARMGVAPPWVHFQSSPERLKAWQPFTRRPSMWAEV